MKPTRRRLLLLLSLVAGLIVGLVGVLLYRDGRHGHRVAAGRMVNHAEDFDFLNPPCEPAGKAEDADIRVAYLGVGGLLIEWRGSMLVTAPYFTRQGMREVLLGEWRVDEAAISRGLEGFTPEAWNILLCGHSHYDHLADVPALMHRLPATASVWTNRSGKHMLASVPHADARIGVLNDKLGDWVDSGINEDFVPFRFMPIASVHAPHLYGFKFAHGTVEEDWDSLDGRKVRAMRDGQSSNFLVDLLDGNRTVFRIFLQDSASPERIGHPPAEEIDGRKVDLAVLTVPPYWQVDDYPEGILESTGAAFALLTHYEDFMQPLDRPLRFVLSLTDARLDRMLERVAGAVDGREGPTPTSTLCGPRGERWAMPLPGEWMSFDVPKDAVLTSGQP